MGGGSQTYYCPPPPPNQKGGGNPPPTPASYTSASTYTIRKKEGNVLFNEALNYTRVYSSDYGYGGTISYRQVVKSFVAQYRSRVPSVAAREKQEVKLDRLEWLRNDQILSAIRVFVVKSELSGDEGSMSGSAVHFPVHFN